MEIIVKSRGEVENKQGQNKPYKVFKLQYVEGGEAKSTQIMSFSKAFGPLLAAAEGEIFEITTKQNGAYTNWETAVSKGMAAPAVVAEATGAPAARGGGNTRNTYETPEERAQKQVYITRSWAGTTALGFMAAANITPVDPDHVLSIAKEFEAYVFAKDSVATQEPVDTRVD